MSKFSEITRLDKPLPQNPKHDRDQQQDQPAVEDPQQDQQQAPDENWSQVETILPESSPDVLLGAFSDSSLTKTLGGAKARPPGSGGYEVAVMKTLLLSDLVNSTALVESLGDLRAAEIFLQHDRLARDLLLPHQGREIDKSDGFLLLFERPINAVLYALEYHRELRELARREEIQLGSRVGIHVGEVLLRENAASDVARGAKQIEVEGLAKVMAARLMSLAQSEQTLISRGIYDLGRRGVVGVENPPQDLHWMAHGAYHLQGVEEPIDLFEVGVVGMAPLQRPPDTEKAFGAEPLPNSAVAGGEDEKKDGRGVFLAVALLFLAVTALFFAVGLNRDDASAIEGEAILPDVRPAVAVIGFRNLNQDQETAWVATALTELLTADLAASGELRLTPGESVERMKRELGLTEMKSFGIETLTMMQENLGVQWVVVGSYLAVDGMLTLSPILQQTISGGGIESIAPRQGGQGDLYSLVARTGDDLRSKIGLGEKELSVSQSDAVRATLSADQDASRSYFQGLRQMREFDFLAARESLEIAIEKDPKYALAHSALSHTWFELGFDERSEQSALRSFELRQNLLSAEARRIEGLYYRAVDRIDDALEVYASLQRDYPDEIEYGLLRARTLASSGRLTEASQQIADLADLPSVVSNDPRIDLLEANVLFDAGNYERAVWVAEQVFEAAQRRQARSLMAQAKLRAGRSYAALGRVEAEPAYEESLALFRSVGEPVREAVVLNALGVLYESRGNLNRAEEAYLQAQQIFEPLGARAWLATTSYNLSFLAERRGRLTAAREQAEASLRLVREIGDRDREARRVWFLGVVSRKQGHLDEADKAAAEALEMHTANGNQRGMVRALLLTAQIASDRGHLETAEAQFFEATEVIERIGRLDLFYEASALGVELALERGELDIAEKRIRSAQDRRQNDDDMRNLRPLRLLAARVLLARGQAAEAEIEAAAVRAAFAEQDLRDDALLADALRVEARWHRLGEEGTRGDAEALWASAQESENPAVRRRAEQVASRALGGVN